MNIPINVVIAVVVIFGFLTGSSLYFYGKNKSTNSNNQGNSESFNGQVPKITGSGQAELVDKNTKPADHRGRVTFPANVYSVKKGETLFGIGSKFQVNWQLIVLANGLESENSIQAGKQLVIPKLSNETDYYRVDFTVNEDNASLLNAQLRDESTSDYYDPKIVARTSAVPYFGIGEGDEFTILEQDNSRGTAVVQAKGGEITNVVGLYQPKQKGEKGFWAILYIEYHE